jgi:hypothetical protein
MEFVHHTLQKPANSAGNYLIIIVITVLCRAGSITIERAVLIRLDTQGWRVDKVAFEKKYFALANLV